jgi:hypothetical protein
VVHPISRVAVSAATVTALTVTGAGASHAQKLSYADGASDVYALHDDDSTTLVGDVVNTDVRSVTIDHRNRTFKAKFGYTDLARTGNGFLVNLHVLTSNGTQFLVYVSAASSTPGSWRGDRPLLAKGNGKSPKNVECASIRRSIDYEANTLKVSLSTDCLGEPRWVRVALKAASVQVGGLPEDGVLYVADDAQRPDVPPTITLSGKIRRG